MSITSKRASAIDLSAGQLHTPAANTAAVITLAATAGKRHYIFLIMWSYNATPTAGNLKIEEPTGTTVFSVDIASAGPDVIAYTLRGDINTELKVTLAAAGAAVTGKLQVFSMLSS